MNARRSWWIAYGAGAAVVLLALGWITVEVLRLERAELLARDDARRQESLRLALWRMDSWIAPRLAREAALPHGDYVPFNTPSQLWTADELTLIESDVVLEPSPLMSFQSDIIPMHFQLDAQGDVTSPQAPKGGQRSVAINNYMAADQLQLNDNKLQQLQSDLDYQGIMECVVADEIAQPSPDEPPASISDDVDAQSFTTPQWQTLRNKEELSRRGGIDRSTKQAMADQVMPQHSTSNDEERVSVGALVPVWIENDGDTQQLVFTRRVQIGNEQILQGFLCDWPALRRSLLDQISDLFARARLSPVKTGTARAPAMLAAIPAVLEVPPGGIIGTIGLTPARFTLMLTWLAALTGIAAVGMTLRSSIAFGQKRSRFASAVTHELRTPLTTFRMYTEMLNDGMVTDDEQRSIYLRTLKDESQRLSTLVENVLSYARLEEGRHTANAEDVTVENLLERVVPTLKRRVESADMSLQIQITADQHTQLHTDADAVEQILLNLVDNACKYARDKAPGGVELRLTPSDDRLWIEVADHGPGIPPQCARSVFAPFDRGENDCGEHPGIGLGLALARSLARDLGGELSLVSSSDQGACFRLELPLSS
jgi:signal transduction histidine kinase